MMKIAIHILTVQVHDKLKRLLLFIRDVILRILSFVLEMGLDILFLHVMYELQKLVRGLVHTVCIFNGEEIKVLLYETLQNKKHKFHEVYDSMLQRIPIDLFEMKTIVGRVPI